MFAIYSFDFLATITEQLEEKLESMSFTKLTDEALRELHEFQQKNELRQGVYLLVYKKKAVYVGKADDVRDRIGQHFRKLNGRRNLDVSKIGFKCLLLDPSMSTAANEDLLIGGFRKKGLCEWNGSGFGAKDPGKERDTTTANSFDSSFPINEDWLCENINDQETVRSLLRKLKTKLPFLLRHEEIGDADDRQLDLSAVDRSAKSVLRAAASSLGDGWQATALKSHMILYKNTRPYTHGSIIYP
jgi:hypothetical protein